MQKFESKIQARADCGQPPKAVRPYTSEAMFQFSGKVSELHMTACPKSAERILPLSWETL